MRKLPWIRLWSDARTDVKLAQLTDSQHRVFVHLLLFAGEQEERGVVPPLPRELLALEVAGGDEALLADTLSQLSRLRIVVCDGEGGGLRFLNWEKRQPTTKHGWQSEEPDAVSARVAKHRQSKRSSNRNQSLHPLQVVTGNDQREIERERRSREELLLARERMTASVHEAGALSVRAELPRPVVAAFLGVFGREPQDDEAVYLANWIAAKPSMSENELRFRLSSGNLALKDGTDAEKLAYARNIKRVPPEFSARAASPADLDRLGPRNGRAKVEIPVKPVNSVNMEAS